MCGICGIVRFDGSPVAETPIRAMTALLKHRGPDGDGCYLRPGLGLGFSRLAIIDLSHASDQPFVDEAAGQALVFNGEIYNYIELRDELRKLGQRFRSDGDGEVILRAYQQWGAEFVSRLNGMFAFAIWDGRARSLFLARDRFGEKPLFIARTPRSLVFASEMKAILAVRPGLRAANPHSVHRYLSRGDLNLDQQTFFAGIDSLPAAHALLINGEGRGDAKPYWVHTAARVPNSAGERNEVFRELLFDSVRLRLRSDVPIGSSLSGGLDSSSIVSAIDAQKGDVNLRQSTFSARFHSATHDEGRFIARVVQDVGAEGHDVWVEPERFVDEFSRLQFHQEEPIASASTYAQFCVMRLAHEAGTTVLLDGQGADELLAGYDQAHGLFWADWVRRGRVDRLLGEAFAFARRYHRIGQPIPFTGYYLLPKGSRDRFAEWYYRSQAVIAPALRQAGGVSPPFQRTVDDEVKDELIRWQTTTQLPEFLRYADRNSMAFSREVRLPFLDHRLVEYCLGLPDEALLDHAVTKVTLRGAMRGIVSDQILDRPDKLAYAPPQRQWMHGALFPWVDRYLAAAEKRRDIFEVEGVRRLRARFARSGNETLAWRVASTEAWFQQVIDAPGLTPGAPAVPNSGTW
ncbi:MAG: asparagine synthase (glutamine-hydrolyzing) [Dehalococcoidia bacterium]